MTSLFVVAAPVRADGHFQRGGARAGAAGHPPKASADPART